MKLDKNNCYKVKIVKVVTTEKDFEVRPILVVCDEMSEVMEGKDYKAVQKISDSISSIARLGRAAACHLVLATQRPSGNVISSDLKNNIHMSTILGGFGTSESTLTLDDDYSALAKPKIKGRGFVKTDQDVIEYQSFWVDQKTLLYEYKTGFYNTKSSDAIITSEDVGDAVLAGINNEDVNRQLGIDDVLNEGKKQEDDPEIDKIVDEIQEEESKEYDFTSDFIKKEEDNKFKKSTEDEIRERRRQRAKELTEKRKAEIANSNFSGPTSNESPFEIGSTNNGSPFDSVQSSNSSPFDISQPTSSSPFEQNDSSNKGQVSEAFIPTQPVKRTISLPSQSIKTQTQQVSQKPVVKQSPDDGVFDLDDIVDVNLYNDNNNSSKSPKRMIKLKES